MKKLLNILIIFSILLTFSCSDDDNNVKPDLPKLSLVSADTLVTGSTMDAELISYAQIKNETEETLTIEVKMEFLELPSGHSGAICTSMCYPPQTSEYTAPAGITLDAGATTQNGDFSAHYYPKDPVSGGFPSKGTGKVKYTFYLDGEPDEMVEYTCTFVVE